MVLGTVLWVGIFLSCREKGKTLEQGMAKIEEEGTPVKTIVEIAIESPNHKTLVEAVKKADLVDALANPGPFTVFAPVDEAFKKVPEETLEDLLKPENQGKLQEVLYYHVYVGVLLPEDLEKLVGKKIKMFGGPTFSISKKGKDFYIDGAKILGSARASNGMVYIVDKVLLPSS